RSSQPRELHFYGDGPDRALLQAQADACGGSSLIVFHGTLLDRSLIYHGLDILVVASRMEGLSLAIMEAMAHQIAIVATDVGGNSRLIHNDCTGLLIPYGDPERLAAALDKLLETPGLRRRLGEAALAFVSENFSLATA